MLALMAGFVGFLIGYLIAKSLFKQYHGPDSNIIKNQIYKKDNICYRFVPQMYICPIFYSMKAIKK